MVRSYCTQYPKNWTNNSAKLVYSNILNYIILLLYLYMFLQSGIILSHTEIYFNTMPSVYADKCYRERFYGTHHGYFKALDNVVENVIHHIIHCLSWSLLRISHLFWLSLPGQFICFDILNIVNAKTYQIPSTWASENLRNKSKCASIKLSLKSICILSYFYFDLKFPVLLFFYFLAYF